MIVLGFDTATHATAVGLRLADGTALSASDDPPAEAHPGHATRLLDLARGLLERAGIGWEAIDRIAVGVGPGRFTGLRVGIATARGLAQSLGAELVGVSSLQALARPAIDSGYRPNAPTIPVIDARRGEVFLAGCTHSMVVSSMGPVRAAKLTEVLAMIERAPELAGERWRAVGDGAVLYAEELRAGGVEVPEPDSPLHRIDGAAVCEMGFRSIAPNALAGLAHAGADAHADADAQQTMLAAVLPDYRRSPDAALARGTAPAAAGGSARA
jgi:tRNA threonylcarbamoyladenosine biosynthesis protein TsaB